MSQTLPPLVRQALDAFVGDLRARFGDRLVRAVLFGSHARGEAWEESDVDVDVVLDRVSRPDVVRGTDACGDALARFAVVIDPSILSLQRHAELKRHGRLIVQELERDGVPL
jgi:predicted nucleotidyltransferase